MEKNEYFMKRAIELAQKGKGWTNPNPMVGAIIVKDGVILGEGWHQKYGQSHAEVVAIEEAYKKGCTNLMGATIYVTLEPCSHFGKTPPCADRIIKEGFTQVIIGMMDPNPIVCGNGIKKLKNAKIQVQVGVLEEECKELNAVFLYGLMTQKSYVHYKSAMSLDGKIRTAGKESKWISSEESRDEVQDLRGYYRGIMVGVQTVIEDNPRLTTRKENCRQPMRIIVDSMLRLPQTSYIVQSATEIPTIVGTIKKKEEYPRWILESGIEVITVDEKNGRCDLNHLMQETYKRGVDSVLLEGGPTLAFSCFQKQLINSFTGYYAPILLGGETALGPIGGAGVNHIAQGYKLQDIKVGTVGVDIKIEGKVSYPSVYRNC